MSQGTWNDPYAAASTPTGHYIPQTIRLTDEEQEEMDKGMTRKQSFSNLTKIVRPHMESINRKVFAKSHGYLSNESDAIVESISKHAEYTLARTAFNMDLVSVYRATAHSVRDRLIEQWNDTQQYWNDQDPKRVYYLSLEFLIGRCLQNHLLNLDLQSSFAKATRELGFRLEDVYDQENDPALGNGGLGRLAACFLDSMATLNYPAWGYGIRYQYGMFEQRIADDGSQQEFPDFWLTQGNPWEIERLDVTYPVRFYGQVESDDKGNKSWVGGEVIQAVAYDMPIPGYDTYNVANLRLWGARPSREFDLSAFNAGNYVDAINARQRAEQISSVLYPNDNSSQGKELRLKQQFFFVSATLRDIVRRFRKNPSHEWEQFPNKVAVQLNDTHPTLGVPELMRVLVDEERLDWDLAWTITTGTYAYTNHTVLPEALEKWSVGLLEHVLPRHIEIIFQINHLFLEQVSKTYPGDDGKLSSMSIIQEGDDKMVRMATLAIVGSHAVNGVAAIHSELIKKTIFSDFNAFFPDKFQNKTNGVTPRRWILGANPGLAMIITKWCETSDWVVDLKLLTKLATYANDPEFQREWINCRKQNKERLASYVKETLGIEINPSALFDVHIKRIHEYKRQFLNILSVARRYLDLKCMTPVERAEMVPRVTLFGGKAAPGYFTAKKIIKLINKIGSVVNNDPDTSEYLKVVFIPNYNVSNAEIIIPASDLSQHISTAGMEASGTSNMKFAMNGCLIIGTWDGANVEICQEIGEEHMFMFGTQTPEVEGKRQAVREGRVPMPAGLAEVIGAIRSGMFGLPDEFHDLLDLLENGGDYYINTVDWDEYVATQNKVDEKYKDQAAWTLSSIISTAKSGLFSTDRTIYQYAEDIWDIKPCPRPAQSRSPEPSSSQNQVEADSTKSNEAQGKTVTSKTTDGKSKSEKKKKGMF